MSSEKVPRLGWIDKTRVRDEEWVRSGLMTGMNALEREF